MVGGTDFEVFRKGHDASAGHAAGMAAIIITTFFDDCDFEINTSSMLIIVEQIVAVFLGSCIVCHFDVCSCL